MKILLYSFLAALVVEERFLLSWLFSFLSNLPFPLWKFLRFSSLSLIFWSFATISLGLDFSFLILFMTQVFMGFYCFVFNSATLSAMISSNIASLLFSFSGIYIYIYIYIYIFKHIYSYIYLCVYIHMDFPGGASDKEPTCQWRRCKSCRFDPWLGSCRFDTLEEGMATHSNILA